MSNTRRILVIANETVEGAALREALRFRARAADAEVLVVSPALNSRLRHWANDDAEARRAAAERLERSLAALDRAGVAARGEVGDAAPLTAIDDALATFPADEVVIATHPPERSHWLERRLVERARERYELPVLHVIVGVPSAAPVEPLAAAS